MHLNFCQEFQIDTTMGKPELLKFVEEQLNPIPELPKFKAGDTITVHYKIKEGNKERIQVFQGIVIQKRGAGVSKSFTVRKVSSGVGVERIFPQNSPNIDRLEIVRHGQVRRAKLFYLRSAKGKAGRIKERRRFTA